MTEAIFTDMTIRDPNAKLAKHVHLDGCPSALGERQRVEVSERDTEVQGKNNALETVRARTTRCCDCGAQEVKILSRF